MLRSAFLPKHVDEASAQTSTNGFAWLRSWSLERRRQRLRREAFDTLLRVDADILEDVTGLQRKQLEHAARLPLSIDALKALRSMQRQEPDSQ
ncbi:hypothetical protein [Aurantimonas sp. A3-2-R12]|uniref:hypothetical protein n=1 Tax=Aurantimonas sp. A3-2-R12 TaxID=3114362 RepID=UPI002E1905AD|nr:hypothetical protein [Aurantimonas sp. A3-2-R12]